MTQADYLDEWRKIREVIREKMRADLRPAFVDPHPNPGPMLLGGYFFRDSFYIDGFDPETEVRYGGPLI